MPESLYTNADAPSNETAESPGPSLGTVIVVAVAGQVTHLKWYCPAVIPTNGAALPFVLYDATTQSQLRRTTASVTPGWNVVAITPVAVTAGQRLLPTVYTGSQYPYTPGYFNSPRVVGNLTAPSFSQDPVGQGRFRSGSDGVPTTGSTGNNYWTDIVFVADATTTPVSKTVRVKWTVAQRVAKAVRSKWPVFQKVVRAVRATWSVSSPPVTPPTVSTAYLRAQRAATMAFIRDDPTTATLIPVSRVKTPGGGFTEQEGAPRPEQTFKLSLLAFDTLPTITIAGVERVISYHLIGPHDMRIAVGDYWVDADGTRWDVVGFTEGWGYMIKALISRHVPRSAVA